MNKVMAIVITNTCSLAYHPFGSK